MNDIKYEEIVPQSAMSEDLQSTKETKAVEKEPIKITVTNTEAKRIYDEAYADRFEYFTKKQHYDEKKADSKARAVAAHTVIMTSLEERRDYVMTEDSIDYETLKNYDVYIPSTIVGNLRHPFLIKQIYKKVTEAGDHYSVEVEWYNEDRNKLCNDIWTPPIKSPEYGSQWSGDAIVPYEIAVAIKDCYNSYSHWQITDNSYSRAEHYYIHKYSYISDEIWTYNNGKQEFKQGDLITGQELVELHNSVLHDAVVYAPTYIDVMLWMTKCSRNEYAFIPYYNNDTKRYYANFINVDYSIHKDYETYEECVIDTINTLYKNKKFHPYFTWYDDELTEEAVFKIYEDEYWTVEECEIYTGISPLGKLKAMQTLYNDATADNEITE